MRRPCARRCGENTDPTGKARSGRGDAESDNDFRASCLPAGGVGAHCVELRAQGGPKRRGLGTALDGAGARTAAVRLSPLACLGSPRRMRGQPQARLASVPQGGVGGAPPSAPTWRGRRSRAADGAYGAESGVVNGLLYGPPELSKHLSMAENDSRLSIRPRAGSIDATRATMEKPHASDPISGKGVQAPEVQTGWRKRRMIVRAMTRYYAFSDVLSSIALPGR